MRRGRSHGDGASTMTPSCMHATVFISAGMRVVKSIMHHCDTARQNSRPAESVSVKFRVEANRL